MFNEFGVKLGRILQVFGSITSRNFMSCILNEDNNNYLGFAYTVCVKPGMILSERSMELRLYICFVMFVKSKIHEE
jgi:hypothetical protein